MNLRRLRFFLRTAAEGSLSKVAQSYGIAQPALTRQIQLLEAELDTQLFERSSRGMKLTETGQYLKEALELPLNEIETALSSVRSYPRQVNASLTIGIPPSLSGLIGSRLVERLRKDLPNIALRIVEEDSAKLASDLARRAIDTAILVAIIPEQRVSQAQVLSEPLHLVGHRAALSRFDGKGIRLPELAKLPLVLPSAPSGLRITLERAAEIAGIKLTPVLEIDSIELARQLVRESNIFAIFPERVFRSEIQRGGLAACPIVEPKLIQPVLWSVRPDWRLPRSLYNELERVVFQEWYDAVTCGDWPGEWVFDFNLLSIPFSHKTKNG